MNNRPIGKHPQNPHYFTYKGSPIILISSDDIDLRPLDRKAVEQADVDDDALGLRGAHEIVKTREISRIPPVQVEFAVLQPDPW